MNIKQSDDTYTRIVYITPRKDDVLAEIREKASDILNNIIRQYEWLKWKKMKDVNGKGREQWYIIADTSKDKDSRLSKFSEILCNIENFEPSPRICPHDLYYEDFEKYFDKYR